MPRPTTTKDLLRSCKGGRTFGYQMATAFSINAAGKITRWHEYYDVKEIEAQVLAAGISIPDE